ncbi:unknown [Bacteroides sp. CAG:770]|nr:unknown [Bacteroides sp. CAG:770]
MVIFEIVWPFAVTLPSVLTSTPGSFFRRSSSMSLSVVLKEEAVYSMVSFFMIIGFPAAVTLAALRTLLSGSIFTMPRSTEFFTVISAE